MHCGLVDLHYYFLKIHLEKVNQLTWLNTVSRIPRFTVDRRLFIQRKKEKKGGKITTPKCSLSGTWSVIWMSESEQRWAFCWKTIQVKSMTAIIANVLFDVFPLSFFSPTQVRHVRGPLRQQPEKPFHLCLRHAVNTWGTLGQNMSPGSLTFGVKRPREESDSVSQQQNKRERKQKAGA